KTKEGDRFTFAHLVPPAQTRAGGPMTGIERPRSEGAGGNESTNTAGQRESSTPHKVRRIFHSDRTGTVSVRAENRWPVDRVRRPGIAAGVGECADRASL